MYKGLSAAFIHRPIATTLIMVAVLLVGLVAFPSLPVAPLPQVDFPTITVSASLPGASPDTMATSVAQPLERQIAQIPGVSQMTSTSSLGATAITVQFDLNRNIDAAAKDIQAAINAAAGQLPKDLPSPPTYRKVNPSDTPILILSVQSDVAPIIDVDDAAENVLAQHLSQISGVSLVRIGGQVTPAVRVQIDPAKLVEMGLQLEDVRSQIAIATVDNPKGAILGNKQTFTIYNNDQLTTAKPWNDVIIAYRNGAPVRIRDIGQAVMGPTDTTQAGWSNGKRSVFLVVFKIPGANVINTVEAIKATLPALQAAIPPTVHVSILSDRTTTIRASVRDVELTLAVTIALVVMVIFVFLRNLWATIIPSVTVPLALLGACGLMWAVGYSLDNLSLMAFTIAVGFVVDDAIVMLENITRHIEEGEKPFEAALKGSAEIGFTIISISVSLVAVLIPLLMMSGIIGRLFREFSVTIAMTIFVSAFVSLTLTPMMASRFLKSHDEERHGRLYNLSEKGFTALANAYARGVDFVLRHRFATLLTFIATVVATVYLFVITQRIFPATGHWHSVRNDRGRAGRFVRRDVQIAATGRSDRYERSGGPDDGDGARHRHRQRRPEQWAHVHHAQAAGGARRRRISGDREAAATTGADSRLQGLHAGGAGCDSRRAVRQDAVPVHPSGRQLRGAHGLVAEDFRQTEVPAGIARRCNRPTKRRHDVTLKIDRDMASRYGIQPQLIDDTLYDAFGQRQVTQYFTQVNTYYVILEVLPNCLAIPRRSIGSISVRRPPIR